MAGGQYRVEAHAAEPTPQNAGNEKAIVDAEAVGDAIRGAVKRADARSGEVAVAISGDAAITKVSQMSRALRSSDLEAQTRCRPTRTSLSDGRGQDFEVLGPNDKDPDSNDAPRVATRSENVAQRQAAVKGHGARDATASSRSSTSARAAPPSACCAICKSCTRATSPSADAHRRDRARLRTGDGGGGILSAGMLGKQSVFLIGPMGSGKTAVGRHLARTLGLPFHDSDTEVERRTGVDIPFIFEKEGEAGFRQREHEAIAALTALAGIVLATGGGAVLLPENRRLLAERGCVVYLKTSVAQQADRVRHGRNRPLLSASGNATTRLGQLMDVRAPLYAEIADVVVPTDGRRVSAVTEQVLRALAASRSAR